MKKVLLLIPPILIIIAVVFTLGILIFSVPLSVLYYYYAFKLQHHLEKNHQDGGGKANYQKDGWLLIFCGICNAILGFVFIFNFACLAIGIGNISEKVGLLYKVIMHNLPWFSTVLLGICEISSILLIIGGILLLFSRKNKVFLTFGLCGIYFCLAFYCAITFLLWLSGGVIHAPFIYIPIAFIIFGPAFFLQRILFFRGHTSHK